MCIRYTKRVAVCDSKGTAVDALAHTATSDEKLHHMDVNSDMGCGLSAMSDTSSVHETKDSEVGEDVNSKRVVQGVALKGSDYRDLLTTSEVATVYKFPKTGFQIRCDP